MWLLAHQEAAEEQRALHGRHHERPLVDQRQLLVQRLRIHAIRAEESGQRREKRKGKKRERKEREPKRR
jgi:hypothetical protein